jgi:hypothetical protein
MLDLSDWLRRSDLPAKPWLIVGHGPTLASRGDFNLSAYSVWGLDHVARELRVDVAHVLEVETVASAGDRLEKNCRWLVMPRRPETNGKPGPPLESCFDRAPVLRRLAAQRRLVVYNAVPASAAPANVGHTDVGHVSKRAPTEASTASSVSPTIQAAAGIIAEMGARRVRSLGLDGGHASSPEFHDVEARALAGIDPLQPPPDVPVRDIEALFHRRGIDYAPLAEPMRVFVAADERLRVPARVLEFSIRRHASGPVVVDFLRHVQPPRPKQLRHLLRSRASLRRFAIPELCGYRGRALYLDAAAVAFADMAELWEVPFGPQKVLCAYQAARPEVGKGPKRLHLGRQLGMMLIDCARLHWDLAQIVAGLDEGRYTHAQLTRALCIVQPDEIADTLPGHWSCLESYDAAHSKLVRYAVPPLYPWKSDDNPLASLWMDTYRDAVAAGAVPVREVTLGVAAGHLKPDLLSAFEGDEGKDLATLRLPLPQRLKLVAAQRAKQVIGHARRLAGETAGRWRSKA